MGSFLVLYKNKYLFQSVIGFLSSIHREFLFLCIFLNSFQLIVRFHEFLLNLFSNIFEKTIMPI